MCTAAVRGTWHYHTEHSTLAGLSAMFAAFIRLAGPRSGPRCGILRRSAGARSTEIPGNRGWARLGSNQRPLACEASALPLSYAPCWQGRGFYASRGSAGTRFSAGRDHRPPPREDRRTAGHSRPPARRPTLGHPAGDEGAGPRCAGSGERLGFTVTVLGGVLAVPCTRNPL